MKSQDAETPARLLGEKMGVAECIRIENLPVF
jgi:hypothetical protein